MDSIYGHGLLKASDYNLYREYCWNNGSAVMDSAICDAVYLSAYYSSYNTNVYGLDWPQCPFEVDWASSISDHGYRGSHHVQRASHLHLRALRAMDRVLGHPDYDSLNVRIPKHELKALHSGLKRMFKRV